MAFLLPFPLSKGGHRGQRSRFLHMHTPGKEGVLRRVRMDVTPALQPEVWTAAMGVVDKRHMFPIQG